MLGELALTASEDLIGQHRGLLETVREHGLDAAYRPLLAGETLREWIAAPSWDASRAFLYDHPELLGEEIPGLLANLTDDPDPAITVHQALLTLARTPAGVDEAYRSLEDEQSLQAMASAAIAARDAGRLRACAGIETFVHGRAFAGALHMVLAWLLDGPAGQLPEGWASELRALAAQADPAEKDTALAQFHTALDSIPGRQRHSEATAAHPQPAATDPRPGQSPLEYARPVSAGGLSSGLIHRRSARYADGRQAALSLAADGDEPARTRARRLGKRVGGNPSRVRISHPPPPLTRRYAAAVRSCT